MKPTREDFLGASCVWRGRHKGIAYELSWHGRSEYQPEGIWCYYIVVVSEQFCPEDWAKLRLASEDSQMPGVGNWHRHWNYEAWPDLDAHGGWTFGEMVTYLGRDGGEHERVKVGCDYAHLWDREREYPDNKGTVEQDAQRSCELLAAMFRLRPCCGYTGRYDDAINFYVARNGQTVHKSQIPALQESGWEQWLPVDAPAS